MARQKKERKSSDKKERSLLGKSLLIALICVLSVLAVALGLQQTYRYVENNVANLAEAPKVVLKDRPAWMSDFLAQQICEAARPPRTHSAMDRSLVHNARMALKENGRAGVWIREIRQLKLIHGERPGDTLMLDCEFRAPIALVKWNDGYYLVDAEGIILTERYNADQIGKIIYGKDGRTSIRLVEGIRSDRPSLPGLRWAGPDMDAALDMIKKILHGRVYTDEIVKLDISNFDGRVDKREPHIVLHTRRNTQIRWGRPVDMEGLAEVSAADKLQKLQAIYAQYGRVDAEQPWIDVRFDRVTKPADPITSAAK